MHWTTLVSAEALNAALDDPNLRVVDARFQLGDAAGGRRAWQQSHLPNAGYVHLDDELSDHGKPASEGRHPLPEAEAFCQTLERLGISADSQVVVYDAAEGAMAAARLWWLLKLCRHERVAVLDGGLARWLALGLPVQTDDCLPSPGHYQATFDSSLIASVEDVIDGLRQASACLLDARAPERFRGEIEPIDPVVGHIPGARNRPYLQNLASGVFRDAEELRREFTDLLAGRRPDETILSCGSGVTACHNLLAMEHAGLHGAHVYAGSWSGWISDGTRPVATGD